MTYGQGKDVKPAMAACSMEQGFVMHLLFVEKLKELAFSLLHMRAPGCMEMVRAEVDREQCSPRKLETHINRTGSTRTIKLLFLVQVV